MTAINKSGGIGGNTIEELIKGCQENLLTLAKEFNRVTSEGGGDTSILEKERNDKLKDAKMAYDRKVDDINFTYDEKIQKAQSESPRIDDIRKDAIRQVDAIKGFRQSLVLIGRDSDDFDFDLPEDFVTFLEESIKQKQMPGIEASRSNELPPAEPIGTDRQTPTKATATKTRKSNAEDKRTRKLNTQPKDEAAPKSRRLNVTEQEPAAVGRKAGGKGLKASDVNGYVTIEQAIMDMYAENGNQPMKPKDIIAYVKTRKKGGQSEASIRTQLHSLKKQGLVKYNDDDKTYKWGKPATLKQLQTA